MASFGMRPEDFWNATPIETDAIASAFMKREELAHRRQSWFTAHMIATLGMFKQKPDLKKLISALNAPVERKAGIIRIASPKDLEEYQRRYGIDLTPNG